MQGSTLIPIVDFSAWHTGSSNDRRRVAHEIADACRHVGFVYVSNHGLAENVLAEAFAWSSRFFGLPMDRKMKAPHLEGAPSPRGYSWPGLEKVSQAVLDDADADQSVVAELRRVPDAKESFDIGSEKLAGHDNVWPPEGDGDDDAGEEDTAGFRAFMTAFYGECAAVGLELMRALALGIGLRPDEEARLLGCHTDGLNNQLRLLHYPAVAAEALEGGEVTRMPAHTDWGTLTMLFQDDCGGLQVEDPFTPGQFVDATPVKGAMVLNVGDGLMRWTNNYLKSTLHRVTQPPSDPNLSGSGSAGTPDASLVRPRYSIVCFVSPDPDATIECFPSRLSAENPAKHTPIVYAGYMRMRARAHY